MEILVVLPNRDRAAGMRRDKLLREGQAVELNSMRLPASEKCRFGPVTLLGIKVKGHTRHQNHVQCR
ncbi:hypothetical protein HYQ46_000605 [Verticillium longisporum]|nr:hypothetical protein HYQ46_000605 [Verticillium longisporum]